MCTYLSSGDHDTDLLDSLGKLIGLDGAVVVQVKVLEGLEQNGFLVGVARSFLGKLGLESLLEAASTKMGVRLFAPRHNGRRPSSLY